MNSLVENGFISELECGANFSYILNDNTTFQSTEYKVLQSQGTGCFVRCMKMLFNGKVQLYYLTQGLKPLSSLVSTIATDRFITIVTNLLSDILEVKSNGFLSCSAVDISMEHIYVEPATCKVSLVYLPTNVKAFEDTLVFENEVRTGLIKIISSIPSLSSPKTMQLSADLSNGTLSVEDIYNRIKSEGLSVNGVVDNENSYLPPVQMKIIAINSPNRVEIIINKNEFVIGKKPELCDGVISFNKMISRSHCKICKIENRYTITDLQSANGTYVNKVRLQPNQSVAVNNGDVIRLANSDFQVVIG